MDMVYGTTNRMRRVVVDCLYGDHPSIPKYLHGFDEDAGEDRTFRIDTITHLVCAGFAISENIPWVIGTAVQHAAGLETLMAPFQGELSFRCNVSSEENTPPFSIDGEIYSAQLRHESNGTRLFVRIRGVNRTSKRQVDRAIDLFRKDVTLADPDGVVIDDIATDFAQACGFNVFGVNPSFDALQAVEGLLRGR